MSDIDLPFTYVVKHTNILFRTIEIILPWGENVWIGFISGNRVFKEHGNYQEKHGREFNLYLLWHWWKNLSFSSLTKIQFSSDQFFLKMLKLVKVILFDDLSFSSKVERSKFHVYTCWGTMMIEVMIWISFFFSFFLKIWFIRGSIWFFNFFIK